MAKVKTEVREFHSRYPNGLLMYPGKWALTWITIDGGTWHLVKMEQL